MREEGALVITFLLVTATAIGLFESPESTVSVVTSRSEGITVKNTSSVFPSLGALVQSRGFAMKLKQGVSFAP